MSRGARCVQSRSILFLFLFLCDLLLSELLVCPAFAVPGERVAPGENEVIEIRGRRELFVDRHLIARMDHLRLELGEPRDEGVVLEFDRPWEGAFCGYATVIHEEGIHEEGIHDEGGVVGTRYHLYYRGLPRAGADGSQLEVTCYARSDDGLRWRKPDLELFEVNGTRKNNVILANAAPASHNFCPFLDRRPAVPAPERFKALGGTSHSGLIAFVSPDGIHWRRLREEPVFRRKGWVFDSQNVPFWSPSEKRYVLYFRSSVAGVRAIARTTSEDFLQWSDPTQMRYSDTATTRPSHHLYTNQTQPYFRAPHIYISTAARFLPERQVLTDEQARAIGVHPRYFRDTSDSVLMSSRGGDLYDRTFPGAFIKPGIGAENWVSRSNYPALNIVQTSPVEMSLYVCQNYGQPTARLHRYSLRLDGLARVRASFEGGELVTRPLRFSGARLVLNFATSAAGGIRVEIQTAAGEPIPGFTLSDAIETIGNEIERAVRWKGGDSVEKLGGQAVRLRIVMKDADLYALRFVPGPRKNRE